MRDQIDLLQARRDHLRLLLHPRQRDGHKWCHTQHLVHPQNVRAARVLHVGAIACQLVVEHILINLKCFTCWNSFINWRNRQANMVCKCCMFIACISYMCMLTIIIVIDPLSVGMFYVCSKHACMLHVLFFIFMRCVNGCIAVAVFQLCLLHRTQSGSYGAMNPASRPSRSATGKGSAVSMPGHFDWMVMTARATSCKYSVFTSGLA